MSNKTNVKIENSTLFDIGINRTVDALHALNKKVIIVQSIPEIGYDVPTKKITAVLSSVDLNTLISPTKTEYSNRIKKLDPIFLRLKEKGITTIDPSIFLCPQNKCLVSQNDTLFYSDDDHLSAIGANLLSPAFHDLFNNQK